MKRKQLLSFIVTALLALPIYAQNKIGDNPTQIQSGSLLELESLTKGLRLPRIVLNDVHTWTLDGTAVSGMLIFNQTGSAPKGIYYWSTDSAQWVQVVNKSELASLVANYLTQNQAVRDSVVKVINNTFASGSIVGKDLTSLSNVLKVVNGSGATMKAAQVDLDKNGLGHLLTTSPVADSLAISVTNNKVVNDSVTSVVNNAFTSGKIKGKDLTSVSNILKVVNGTGATLKSTQVDLDKNGLGHLLTTSPVADSLAISVTNNKIVNDSVTSVVNNAFTSGKIKGKDLTSLSNVLTVVNGTGATIKAAQVDLDKNSLGHLLTTSPVADSLAISVTNNKIVNDSVTSVVNNAFTSGKIKGKDLTSLSNVLKVVNGTGATMKAAQVDLDKNGLGHLLTTTPVADSLAISITKNTVVRDSVASIVKGSTTNNLTASSNKFTSVVNGVSSTIIPAAGTITNNIGFDATGNLVKQAPAATAITHTLAAATNTITSTVNGVAAALSPATGTIANNIGFDASGNLVKQAPVATATTNALSATSSTLTSTVNGVSSAITPAAGTTTNVLGFDATGTLVKQTASSLPVTNTSTLTQAGGLVNTVNGVAATTAIPTGTVTNLLGYSSTGTPVYQSAATVLSGATTHLLTAASSTITSTVNGVSSVITPAAGTTANVLGFDATGALVKQTASSLPVTNAFAATSGTLTTTINGVAATLTPAAGTIANNIGFDASGNLVKQAPAATATTNVFTAATSTITSVVNGVSSAITPAAGTTTNVLGFDATGTLVKQTASSLPVTNTIANSVNTITSTVNGVVSTTSAVNTHTLTAATSALTSTVNGVTATLTPAAGTIANNIGFDASGNLVKQAPAATATTNVFTAATSTITSTVNGVSSAITPAAGTTTNVLGFDATGALVKQTASSLPVTNTSTLTQAGGLVNTVNGVAATTAIPTGTVTNLLGYSSTGTPVYQSAASVLSGATTHLLTAASSTITSTVNGVSSAITPAAGTTTNVLGFDATGALVKQTASSLPVTNTSALTQAGGLVNTVNGVAATTAIPTGTVTNLLGYSSTGTPVYQSAATVLSGATTHLLTAASSTITSTVNGVSSVITPAAGTIANNIGFDASGNLVKQAPAATTITHTFTAASSAITSVVNGVSSAITPAVGTTANVLGFDATGALVKQTASSLSVTNTSALTQAGGLVNTVNGVAATTAIPTGTIANVLGFSSTGTPVYQSASAVLTAATTNNLTAASSILTSTVNGVTASLAPADGTVAKTLGFDASGNLVKGSVSASSNLYTADGTLTAARTVTQNNLDLTFTTGTAKTIVDGSFKTTGALYAHPVRDAGGSITWQPDDVFVILTSGTGNIILPSASANPGRVVGINNRSGSIRALANTAGGDTGIYTNEGWGQFATTVGMVLLVSDGTSWRLCGGRP